jgi:hypothetical protein
MKYFNSQLGNIEETSNIGKLWSVDENNELYKEVENNKNYSQIAAIHKRTEKAIILRVISNIIYPKYKNNEMTLDQLSFEYNIEKDLIEKNIAKYENQPKKPKEQQTNIDKILSDLDNRLFRLEQKIDYIISSFLREMK